MRLVVLADAGDELPRLKGADFLGWNAVAGGRRHDKSHDRP